MGLVSSNISIVGDTQEANSIQGPFIGTLYDHFGPRWLLLIGSIMHIFGVMMASLGTEYYQILLAQGVCSAIGISGIFQPGVNNSAWIAFIYILILILTGFSRHCDARLV